MKNAIMTLLIVGCMLIAGSAFADEYTQASFTEKFNSIQDEDQLIELCKDYMTKATDIDLIRNIQSQWESVDEEGVRQFSKELFESNSTSAKFAYLYGRVVETPVEQVEMGRKAIALSMMWPYGYRLVTATYMTYLFDAGPDDEFVNELKAMLPEDEKHFKTLVTLEKEEDYPLQFLFSYQKYAKDTDGALATLNQAKEKQARWVSPIAFATVYAMQDKLDLALTTLTEFIDAQGVAGDERQMYIDYYYRNGLVSAGKHADAIKYLETKADYTTNADAVYDVACLHSLQGNTEEAYTTLAKAITAGYDKIENAKQDGDLIKLHEDARWEGILTGVQKNWDDGKPKRKVEALALKVSEAAPDWSLENKDGTIVKLAELKGTVVVLDFWATWCGPCRMAMPVLDDFVKTKAKDGVKVFSVNVWERTPGKAMPLKFMTDNEYAMTLLYGDNDLTTAYGVQGIPFICVIDKEGNICFKESGYSEQLGENLVWWTESLL